MRSIDHLRKSWLGVGLALLLGAGCMGTVSAPTGSEGTGPEAHATKIPGGPVGMAALAIEESEILVRFNVGVMTDGSAPPAFLADHGLWVRRCSPALDACGLLFDAWDTTLPEIMAAVRADPRVDTVSLTVLAEAATTAVADLTELQWNLEGMEIAGATSPADGDLGETIVALLDTGVSPVAGLAGVPLVEPYDFVNDDSDASDDHFHGTHLAGVISDATPGVGTTAVSPGLAIMPVKVLSATALGTELDLADGIMWAVDHGASVINMSLAFPAGFYPSKVLQDAVAYAQSANVIMVAAAGNGGLDGIVYPAAFRAVIAVGASKVDPAAVGGPSDWGFLEAEGLMAAPYSNTGGKLDILAPGGVLDEDLNGDGYADGILAETFAPGDPTTPGYWILAGTSHAAAHVSSLVARILANCPGLTPDQMRMWLGEDAEHTGDVFDPSRGYGFIDGGEALELSYTSNGAPVVRDMYAGVMVTLHDVAAGIEAHATVQILNRHFRKAPAVTVIGTWIGAATGTVTGVTDSGGNVTFTSPLLVPGGCAAGFQVDAVLFQGGNRMVHPRGFTGINLDSLNLLQANAALIGDVPTILTFPTLVQPGIRTTVTLANFGPDLTTPPTSVAIDAGCYAGNFPMESANALTVSSGQLIGDVPTILSPGSAFPFPVLPPAVAFPGVSLRVLTFDPSLSMSPLRVDRDATSGGPASFRGHVEVALDRWFEHHTIGGPIPVQPGSNSLTPAQWAEAGNLVAGYLAFLAGDQDESTDELAAVVSVTAVALPTGTTASSAFVGAVPGP